MDTHETSSKSQTPSSKSQGSFKIQHSKAEAAFGARRGGDVDNDGSFDVFVGSESLKTDMKAIDAYRVKIFAEGRSSNDQVSEILKVVADPFTKSPVRVAIEGANHG